MRTKKIEKPTYLHYKKYAKGANLKTYRNKYNIKYGYPENESHDLEQISKDSGVSLKGLQQIYNKGIGAYKTNPESVRKNVKSKEQWAMGRVYSAVMGGKASKIDANELKMEKGGLLAPNGNPSNLTPEQYNLVRTLAFKKWFGDWENDPENSSKVVDENGEPLVCYHGTDKEFNVFDFDKADLGFHFGTYEQAKNRAENKLKLKESKSIIRPFFINIKNVYELTDVGEWEYPQRYIDTLISYNIIDEKDAKRLGFFRLYQKEDNIKIREYLLEKYKNSIGFIYNNEYEGKGQSFIILNSSQIKLADGSNTTFDGSNPDIRYESGGISKMDVPLIENSISLPDTYSSYNALKPILENQGYELIKKTNSEMSTETLEIEDDRSVSDLDNKYPNIEHSFINKQLMSGIKHELQHDKKEPRLAKKIAIDHLLENIHYYEYLAEMEQKMQGKNIDEHYESITKLYADGGTVETFEFSTPTGKPSKLNYLQQVLVRTKAFKNFFGDWELAARRYKKDNLSYDEAYKNVSKCIDMSTLEPRVVYHGTQADKEFFTFDVTQERKEGRPYAYFAYNREYSLNFSGGTNSGYLYAVFLNIRNPFDAQNVEFAKLSNSSYWLTTIKGQLTIDKYGDLYRRKELDDAVDSQIKKYIEEVYANENYYFWLLMARDVNKDFKYFLMSHGYDGIFASENFKTVFDVENPSEFTFTYIAFDANQIKLADGRNIDFDPMNSDIRYEEGGKTKEEVKENIVEMQTQEPLSKIESLRSQLLKSSGDDINQKIFKSGGHVEKSSGSPDDAKDGGLFVGRSHANGGIKAINLSTNQPIEVEGGEVIITKPAVEDQTKREFEGKMMTNKEILSHINESGGGVSFAKGGEMCGCSGKMYKFGGETLSDYMILRKISNLYDESVTNLKNYVDNLTEQLKHI